MWIVDGWKDATNNSSLEDTLAFSAQLILSDPPKTDRRSEEDSYFGEISEEIDG